MGLVGATAAKSEFAEGTATPLVVERAVGKAIAYAIDRNFIIDNVQYGFGKPATGPISSNFKPSGLYTDDVMRFDVPDHIAIANKLLDDAGLPRKDNGTRRVPTTDYSSSSRPLSRRQSFRRARWRRLRTVPIGMFSALAISW